MVMNWFSFFLTQFEMRNVCFATRLFNQFSKKKIRSLGITGGFNLWSKRWNVECGWTECWREIGHQILRKQLYIGKMRPNGERWKPQFNLQLWNVHQSTLNFNCVAFPLNSYFMQSIFLLIIGSPRTNNLATGWSNGSARIHEHESGLPPKPANKKFIKNEHSKLLTDKKWQANYNIN